MQLEGVRVFIIEAIFLAVILRWIPQVFAPRNTIVKYSYYRDCKIRILLYILRFQCSAEFANLVSSLYCQPDT